MEKAIYLIKKAALHDCCSSGELVLTNFIHSCLNYEYKVNIKEVLYRADLDQVLKVIECAQNGILLDLVQEFNPNLLVRES